MLTIFKLCVCLWQRSLWSIVLLIGMTALSFYTDVQNGMSGTRLATSFLAGQVTHL